MKTPRTLYRVHGPQARKLAEQSAEVIKGYFSNLNKRVSITVEPFDRSVFPADYAIHDTPLPYDVKITTTSDETEAIAHAAGWAYIEGVDDATRATRELFETANNTFHDNPKLAEELKRVAPLYSV